MLELPFLATAYHHSWQYHWHVNSVHFTLITNPSRRMVQTSLSSNDSLYGANVCTPAISAVCVIFVGILGAVFGHSLLNMMRIGTKALRGLAMGAASHALGTTLCRTGFSGRCVQHTGSDDLWYHDLSDCTVLVSYIAGGVWLICILYCTI